MAKIYTIQTSVCNSDGSSVYFDFPVYFTVYSTDEWNSLKQTYISRYGTSKARWYRNNPLQILEPMEWCLNNIPVLKQRTPIIRSEKGADNVWFQSLSENLNLFLCETAFKTLPITSSTSTLNDRQFYLKRKADNVICGPFVYRSYISPDSYRTNIINNCECLFSSMGSGTGSSDISYYTCNLKYPVAVVPDPNNFTLTGNEIKQQVVDGYLQYGRESGLFGSESTYFFWSGSLNYAQERAVFAGAEPEPYDPSPDPYKPGGTSTTGGGEGTFDLTSDSIDVPNLPTLSATNAGLVTVYVPDGNELYRFASLLFGRTFLDAFLNAITTLFVDPLEAVIGLAILPVSPSLSAPRQVTVAFIGLGDESGALTMHPAATQYVEIDCGTLFVDETFGSALDYSPYSKFHIYLPYIGTRELSTDEIRNKNVHVIYHIDIVSGACVAFIKVDDSVLYQFAGNCATPIPINGRDFSRMVTAGIQLAAAFTGGSAGTGVGAAAAGNIGKPDDYISTDSSFKTLIRTLDSDEGITPTANKSAGGKVDAEHLVSATAGVVSGMKPHIQHASGIGGSAGMLGIQKPYLIAEIPRQSLASNYNKFVGYPSNITSLLGDLSGFTQIEMIHLKGIPCTETELAEIDKMLRNGVIL